MLIHGIARSSDGARSSRGARPAPSDLPARPAGRGRAALGRRCRDVPRFGPLALPPLPTATASCAPVSLSPLEAGASSDLEVLATAQAVYERQQAERAEAAAAQRTDKVLAYDPALIAAIGNQANGSHTVCCPGYACAYGDAVLTGQARDHAAYGCGCCTWPG